MQKRIKKKEHENLTAENIRKVIKLLNPEEGKPITKKEGCAILNIAYNTTRLKSILEEFVEREAYVAKRKKQNRGTAATNEEIKEAVTEYLQGETVTEIARLLYRPPAFVKEILERVGVPNRPATAEERAGIGFIPEECVSETFEEGSTVWSAVYHTTGIVGKEVTIPYQNSKKGLGHTDYENKYCSKCYQLYVLEKVDSEGSLFPGVESGGFSAYSLAYDLAKLTHLEQYGINLSKI